MSKRIKFLIKPLPIDTFLIDAFPIDETQKVAQSESMRFFSDNAAPVHPQIMEAVSAANVMDTAYDGDAWSQKLDAAFGAVFECEVKALWVSTGTAANCLALAGMAQSHQGIVCHEEAHIEMDEAGAPGFFTGGAKLMHVAGDSAKLTTDNVRARIALIRDDVHQVQPAALSITNATEYGLSYTPEEVAELGALAKEKSLRFHMDGARFANGLVHAGCAPADITWRAGVDALSFGCVKNGAMNAEALIFFDRELAKDTYYRRKQAGHLLSKGRFSAAQLLAMLEGDLWLKNAKSANDAAKTIAEAAGDRLLYPVEANEIFIRLDANEAASLRKAGFDFYDWPNQKTGEGGARLVTSWQHTAEDVEPLADAIARL